VKRALAGLLVASAAAAAEPKVSITGPASLVGDGKSVATLTVTVEGAGEPVVGTDAGTVGALKPLEPGRFSVELTAPRVAVDMAATVSAAAGGKRATAAVTIEPPPAEIREARSGGPLDLRAPERLLLGRDGGGWISVSRAASIVGVSAGKVGALEAAPGGRMRARYTPPDSKLPQWAIVVASDGRDVDWMAIALDGQPRIETHTKPNALVSIRVAGVEFGPVRTDGKGRAGQVVVVPPGVGDGRTVAIDRLGNRGETALSLQAPVPNRLFAVCERERVRLFAVDGAGRPKGGEKLALSASAGAIDAAVERGPGVYEAAWRAPEGSGEVRLTATVPGDAAARAGCAVSLAARPVAIPEPVPTPPPVVVAPPPRPHRALVAARVGFMSNFAKLTGPFAAAEVGYRLPFWKRALSVGVLGGYYGGSHGEPTAEGVQVDVSIGVVPILARLAVQLPLPPSRFGLSLGVSGGALVAHGQATSMVTAPSPIDAVVPAGGGFAIAELALGPGRLGVEISYLYGELHGAVSGNAGGLSGLLGYRLEVL
jgi:hypothetical protein